VSASRRGRRGSATGGGSPRSRPASIAIRAFAAAAWIGAVPAQVTILDAAARELVAADAQVEVLAADLQFAEGPVWFAKEQALVFSDVRASRLMRWTRERSLVDWLPSEASNGNTLDLEGRLVSCQHGARNVVRQEADGSMTVLADRFDGRAFNSPNDVAIRCDGTIWFTDPTYGLGSRSKEQPGPSSTASTPRPASPRSSSATSTSASRARPEAHPGARRPPAVG
jgi:sugar lactone lactonase YvrE